MHTVRAEIFAVVLFSRISQVKPSRKFPLQFMSIYSNDNISKIAKLTTHELPHLTKTAKITVRENNGVYSTWIQTNGIFYFCFKKVVKSLYKTKWRILLHSMTETSGVANVRILTRDWINSETSISKTLEWIFKMCSNVQISFIPLWHFLCPFSSSNRARLPSY